MKTHRKGITLIELMIVMVLLAVTLGGVYQTLAIQEETYRTGSAAIQNQETLRTALGILEAELREVSTTGTNIGGVDIAMAAADSIRFRAHRKIGFICEFSAGGFTAAVVGDEFENGDSLLIFADNGTAGSADDAWVQALVNATPSNATSTACNTQFPGLPIRNLNVSGSMVGVQQFSPVRGFEWVRYGIHRFPEPEGWSLARWTKDEGPVYLVGGLDDPGVGLVFTYFDQNGNPTNTPSQISSIRISVQVEARPGTGLDANQLTTVLFLRNN